jgi:hypothetical protein
MTTKFISLASAIVTLDVYLQSQLYSSDPLFSFASDNILVNLGLVILAALTVAVSFRKKFRSWISYLSCVIAAVGFGTLGFMGAFFGNLLYSFPNVLQPLDSMFLMEAAVVFGLCALTHEHEPLPFGVRLPKVSVPLPNFAFPVLKIPHSPTSFTRSGSETDTRNAQPA